MNVTAVLPGAQTNNKVYDDCLYSKHAGSGQAGWGSGLQSCCGFLHVMCLNVQSSAIRGGRQQNPLEE